MRVSRESMFAIIVVSASMLVMLGLCEISLRVLLFSDSLSRPIVRQAWRYSDGIFEDDYWKLMYLFEGDQDTTKAGVFDPTLG